MDRMELYQQVKDLLETTDRPLSIADIVTTLRLDANGDSSDTVRKRVSRLLERLEKSGLVRTASREGSSPGVATLWKAMNPRKKEAVNPDAVTAIAVELLEAFLTPSVLRLLEDPLRSIAPTLTTVAARKRLKERVITVLRRPQLLPPQGKTQVMSQVLDAVFDRRCFCALYNSRAQGKETYQQYHALGLVVRENTIYVVACLDWNKEVRHYALHRFTAFRSMPHKPVEPPDHFTLRKWLQDSDLGDKGGKVRIALRMARNVAHHLQEMPLSRDQKIVADPDDEEWVCVSATVHNNEELVWWILGFGALVEVLEPAFLRSDVAARLRNAARLYAPRKGGKAMRS